MILQTQKEYIQYLKDLTAVLATSTFELEPIKSLSDQVQDQELLIPVIGAFSAGKSTLMNAFIDADVLPVGIAPETELATELRYGTDPHLLAIRKDETTERFDVSEMNQIKSRSSEFTHLRLYLNNQRLKDIMPLVLVDMPGFGSSLENHNKAISYYLPRGVYFLVVVSVDEGNITRSMLRQLNELQTFERDFTILVSKANLRADQDVAAVVSHISDQLDIQFSKTFSIASVGFEGGEQVANILSKVNPEKIFEGLYLPHLKDHFHSVIGQINVAKAAIKNDKSHNEQAIADLNTNLKQIESKRDHLIADLESRYSDRVTNNCVEYAGRKLSDSIDELVSLASKGNTEQFSNTVFEIVRDSVIKKLKDEVQDVSHDVVDQFSIELTSLNQSMANFGTNQDWTGDLSNKIKSSLELGSNLITQLSGHLSSNTDAGRAFKGVATVLAVTTGVLAPVVELVIIFLPDIINYLSKGMQEKQLRNSIQSDIIPSIKRELRNKLPANVKEQLDAMIRSICDSFESDLAEKREIIVRLESERGQKKLVVEEELQKLDVLEKQVVELANSTIYS